MGRPPSIRQSYSQDESARVEEYTEGSMAIGDADEKRLEQITAVGPPPHADPEFYLRLIIEKIPVLGKLATASLDYYSKEEKKRRFEELIRSFENRFDNLEQRVSELEDPKFLHAFWLAVDLSVRTPIGDRPRQFGSLLGAEGSPDKPDWEKAATLIQTLSQLNDRDLLVLRVIDDITKQFDGLSAPPAQIRSDSVQQAAEEDIGTEEFDVRGGRLFGFGLVGAWSSPVGSTTGGIFRITYLGRDLLAVSSTSV